MATAFVGNLKFSSQSGANWQTYITANDTAANNYIFPDGNGFLNLPNNLGVVYLVDVILSTGGASCPHSEIWVNGVNTGLQIVGAANLTTNPSRQFWGQPLKFSPGARLQIIQRA